LRAEQELAGGKRYSRFEDESAARCLSLREHPAGVKLLSPDI
jgi:hypothetical protein